MKWAIMVPSINEELWVYICEKDGSPKLFDVHMYAEHYASQYKRHRIVEYEDI